MRYYLLITEKRIIGFISFRSMWNAINLVFPCPFSATITFTSLAPPTTTGVVYPALTSSAISCTRRRLPETLYFRLYNQNQQVYQFQLKFEKLEKIQRSVHQFISSAFPVFLQTFTADMQEQIIINYYGKCTNKINAIVFSENNGRFDVY